MVMHLDWFVNWRFNFAHSGIVIMNPLNLIIKWILIINNFGWFPFSFPFLYFAYYFVSFVLGIQYPVFRHHSIAIHLFIWFSPIVITLAIKISSFYWNISFLFEKYNNNQTSHAYKKGIGFRPSIEVIWNLGVVRVYYVFERYCSDISLLLRFCCSFIRLCLSSFSFRTSTESSIKSRISLRSFGWYQHGIIFCFVRWHFMKGFKWEIR